MTVNEQSDLHYTRQDFGRFWVARFIDSSYKRLVQLIDSVKVRNGIPPWTFVQHNKQPNSYYNNLAEHRYQFTLVVLVLIK